MSHRPSTASSPESAGTLRAALAVHFSSVPPRLSAIDVERPGGPRGDDVIADPDRLRALRSSGLMDSAAEESFDRFTRLAASSLGVPVALVSLVDDARQFFKSAVGLPEPWATRRETPLSHSFCKHVVSLKHPFVVDDSSVDPRVKGNGAVVELGVAAYAGVPLVSSDDFTLGALCAVEPQPRAWTSRDIEVLTEIAAAVSVEIDLRRSLRRMGEREAVFRAVFDHAPMGVLIVDDKGQIRRANERLRGILGHERDALAGTWIADLDHPDDTAVAQALRAELLAGKRDQVDLEMRCRTTEGSHRWVRVTGSLAQDPDNRQTFTILMFEDIEEERRIKQALDVSERRYRTLVRHLPNTSVLMFDHELRHVVADGDAVLRDIGTSGESLVGRTITETASPENRAGLERVYRMTLAGTRTQGEFERRGRHLEVRTAPVYDDDGRVSGGMVLTYDITKLKRTEAALRQQNAAIALLGDIAAAANHAQTSCEVFHRALDLVGDHMGWPVGHVFVRVGDEAVSSDLWRLVEPERHEAFRRATQGMTMGLGNGLIGIALETGRAQVRLGIGQSTEFLRADVARDVGLQAAFALPVLVGDAVVAVLEFYSPTNDAPDAQSVTLMVQVGTLLGRVVERERHAASVIALSMRDELTGLLNRRGFFDLAGQMHDSGHRFAILFGDLNGLKQINDGLGHEAGDSAIRDAADVLRRVFREGDLIARLGGDEFVVLARDVTPASAKGLPSRLASAMDAFNQDGTRPYRLSMSVGLTLRDEGETRSLDALMAEADARMYERKASARLAAG
jgi:diguanylate cyclase (GGDEF)-like protein/PAS domain S-box-containing protein